MTTLRFLFSLVFISLLFRIDSYAQVTTFDNAPGGHLYCVWNQVTLRSGPGKTAPYLNGVFFGEIVEKTGEEAYAREEQRTYIKVRTSEGVVGWVHEFLFIEGIGMAVVTEPGKIYKRPRTVSTITDQSFLPGELVVLVSENNGWINLIGREKKKLGWIEGASKVTTSFQEQEIASLFYDAKKKTKPEERQQALAKLLEEARASRSPLTQAIEMEIRGQNYQLPLVDARPSTQTQTAFTSQQTDPFSSRLSYQQPVEPEPAFQSGYTNPSTRNEYLSSLSSTTAQRQQAPSSDGIVTESGRATIISSISREPDIYYAFHKDLPVGSKLYVDIPGNTGFIELRVVGKLPNNSPFTVGLPVACYDALLGNSDSRELSITYQQ